MYGILIIVPTTCTLLPMIIPLALLLPLFYHHTSLDTLVVSVCPRKTQDLWSLPMLFRPASWPRYQRYSDSLSGQCISLQSTAAGSSYNPDASHTLRKWHCAVLGATHQPTSVNHRSWLESAARPCRARPVFDLERLFVVLGVALAVDLLKPSLSVSRFI